MTAAEGPGNLVLFRHRGLTGVVRASLHYYNTEDEVDYFVRVLEAGLRRT